LVLILLRCLSNDLLTDNDAKHEHDQQWSFGRTAGDPAQLYALDVLAAACKAVYPGSIPGGASTQDVCSCSPAAFCPKCSMYRGRNSRALIVLIQKRLITHKSVARSAD